MRKKAALLLIIGSLAATGLSVVASQQAGISDRGIGVVRFEDLKYPAPALNSFVEGAVAVRVSLDSGGNVIEASAISGSKLLTPACLNNVKKWRFEPNKSSAVVVYNFRTPPGGCESKANPFLFQPPNLATVIGCGKAAEDPILTLGQQDQMVTDEDMKLVSSDPIRYPAIGRSARIQGVVVVRVGLDEKGKVSHATALSGPEPFVAASIANARKWRFRPNPQKAAVIIYNFRLTDAISGCDHFTLEPPNFATITTCPVPVNAERSTF